jgi:glycosyltransferase involved in cell wall biosynthesis
VLVGEGPEKESLEHYVASRHLANLVRFIGEVDDVRPYLSLFDVFVMPSTAVEVFSNAMLEAIAMGVPVISSDVGGSAEMIEHDKEGMIYPRNDVDRLTHYLDRLISEPALADRLRSNALRRLQREFTVDKMDSEFLALIRAE